MVVKKGAPDDGTTAPMRPLPGGSRMYPETDVPPHAVTAEQWADVLSRLPMDDQARADRLSTTEASSDQAQQLLARELDDVYMEHASSLPHKAWASLLLTHDDEDPLLLVNVLTLEHRTVLLVTMSRPWWKRSAVNLRPSKRCKPTLRPTALAQWMSGIWQPSSTASSPNALTSSESVGWVQWGR